MEKAKPIKRSRELAALSRDHHDGLLLCWKINKGISKEIPTSRISNYLIYFFDHFLAPHFDEEEQYLFPILRSDNAERHEAEAHHRILRDIVFGIRLNNDTTSLTLKYFAFLLERHIRFEERVLFNSIESVADKDYLSAISSHFSHQPGCDAEWKDVFWVS